MRKATCQGLEFYSRDGQDHSPYMRWTFRNSRCACTFHMPLNCHRHLDLAKHIVVTSASCTEARMENSPLLARLALHGSTNANCCEGSIYFMLKARKPSRILSPYALEDRFCSKPESRARSYHPMLSTSLSAQSPQAEPIPNHMISMSLSARKPDLQSPPTSNATCSR